MANYESATRTNYFRVKDPAAFREFMSRVYGSDEVQLWEEKDLNDTVQFGFGVYGGISGFCPSEDEEDDDSDYDYDAFLDELQRHIADDDAVIIMEGGNEKLRYVVGSATIVTSKTIEYLGIKELAEKQVRKLLNNPDWLTRCEY